MLLGVAIETRRPKDVASRTQRGRYIGPEERRDHWAKALIQNIAIVVVAFAQFQQNIATNNVYCV